MCLILLGRVNLSLNYPDEKTRMSDLGIRHAFQCDVIRLVYLFGTGRDDKLETCRSCYCLSAAPENGFALSSESKSFPTYHLLHFRWE